MLRTLLPVFFCVLFFSAHAQNADIRFLRSCNGPVNSQPDALMRGVSNSVLPLLIAVPTGLLVYDRVTTGSWTEKQEPYVIGVSVAVTIGLSYGMKKLIDRPRPFVTYSDIVQKDPHVGPYSFPSGHTGSAFALATSVSLCFPKWYVIAPAAVWAVSVGYSRMYLGVHYPSDVIAGAFIGTGCALLTYQLNRLLWKEK